MQTKYYTVRGRMAYTKQCEFCHGMGSTEIEGIVEVSFEDRPHMQDEDVMLAAEEIYAANHPSYECCEWSVPVDELEIIATDITPAEVMRREGCLSLFDIMALDAADAEKYHSNNVTESVTR